MSLTSSKVASLSPNVSCLSGLLFPTTSVVDVQGLCQALELDARSNSPDSHVLTNAKVTSLSPDPTGGYDLTVRQGTWVCGGGFKYIREEGLEEMGV